MHTVFAHSVHTCTHTMCTTSTYCLSYVCAWCTGSVHGVNVQYMVCTFCGLCGSSVHGVHVLCMVWTFCAWCARSVHGSSLSISTSQARFQPLCIYMYMYIEVAVCHCIIIILQLQYNVVVLELHSLFTKKLIRVRE